MNLQSREELQNHRMNRKANSFDVPSAQNNGIFIPNTIDSSSAFFFKGERSDFDVIRNITFLD